MAKTYGVHFPERPLMATLSDLLAIPHFTTSRGSTVRREFLEAVCVALGVDNAQIQSVDKDGVLRLAVEAATGRPMPKGLLSPGETVTNDALQVIIQGVMDQIEQGRIIDPSIDPLVATPPTAEELVIIGERVRRLREEAVRQGQSAFRRRLLEAYGGRCSLSGTNAVQVLEAAHIIPFSDNGSDSLKNGLLLRSDLHRLFDAGALAIDDGYRVVLSSHLASTSYSDLEGARLRLPKRVSDRPSLKALRSHRVAAGLHAQRRRPVTPGTPLR